mmetsp:Transcript_48273/g.87064  ORF Transcript_48273/g.87064 Transcript_48273/m.87064 type:complete len:208 (+) Transcript_48273:111-734(+)
MDLLTAAIASWTFLGVIFFAVAQDLVSELMITHEVQYLQARVCKALHEHGGITDGLIATLDRAATTVEVDATLHEHVRFGVFVATHNVIQADLLVAGALHVLSTYAPMLQSGRSILVRLRGVLEEILCPLRVLCQYDPTVDPLRSICQPVLVCEEDVATGIVKLLGHLLEDVVVVIHQGCVCIQHQDVAEVFRALQVLLQHSVLFPV